MHILTKVLAIFLGFLFTYCTALTAPALGPGWENPPQWLFALYFQNIANFGCTTPNVLIGFQTDSANYLKGKCINVDTLIAAYLLANWVWGGGSSQWKDIASGISFTWGIIGIGTRTPDKLLHVVYNNPINDGNQWQIVSENTSTTGNAGIALRVNGPNTAAIQFSQWPWSSPSNTGWAIGYDMGTAVWGSPGFIFYTRKNSVQTAQMVIKDNGNVGIGTMSPIHKLSVTGTDCLIADCALAIRLATKNTIDDNSHGTTLWKSDIGFGINNKENTPMVLATNNTEKLRITGDGKVGIGTTSPTETLTVSGRIIALDPVASNNVATKGYVDAIVLSAGGWGGWGKGITKKVFMTSTVYNGNLWGLTGADAKCQARATAKGLSWSWIAAISINSVGFKDRLGSNWDTLVDLNGFPIDTVGNIWRSYIYPFSIPAPGYIIKNRVLTTEDKNTYAYWNANTWWPNLGWGKWGGAYSYCMDWTSDREADQGLSTYLGEGGVGSYAYGYQYSCNNPSALICVNATANATYVTGECGSAYGNYFYGPPTAADNLCLAGQTASAVTAAGWVYVWTCTADTVASCQTRAAYVGVCGSAAGWSFVSAPSSGLCAPWSTVSYGPNDGWSIWQWGCNIEEQRSCFATHAVAPTCSDGIQNQSETAVDCGGPNCAACPVCNNSTRNQCTVWISGNYYSTQDIGWPCTNPANWQPWYMMWYYMWTCTSWTKSIGCSMNSCTPL